MAIDDKKKSAKGNKPSSPVNCSFCGKSESEVQKMIAVGKHQKPICNECIVTCKQILKDTL